MEPGGNAAISGLHRRADNRLRYKHASGPEVLIAGGLGLPVPQGFIFNMDRSELRDAFKANNDVSQICNRGVAVVEIKLLPEFFRRVAMDPSQAILNGISGAAVAGQRIRRFFGGHRGERENPSSGAGHVRIIGGCLEPVKSGNDRIESSSTGC